MLLLSPIFYYSKIKEKFSNSYLAEDVTQVIIGIDCKYISSNEMDFIGLKSYFYSQSFDAPFAGLFGVMSYECIRYFEKIPNFNASAYDFPNFIYANANAYLHFDKNSKIYTFYGDKIKYYDFLENFNKDEIIRNGGEFKICTNLAKEKEHFLDIVNQAKHYLANGDIFQVVISEQLKLQTNLNSLEFYIYLSKANPSPYMFHFPTPFGDVVGSSPELVCEIKGEQIYVAPIAGTRGRGENALEDDRLKNELLSDEKELCEHKMLIDLARNDIGKVSKPRSVIVKNPLHVVMYESVMHIVSDVFGSKKDDVDMFDIIPSIFPAGTLSGTPKIRAMQIISELEIFKRNIYGGGIGFLHFNGNATQAILIRSAIFTPLADSKFQSNVFIRSGAGIVIDSIGENEYKEICKKRASVINVFVKNCREI